MRKPRNLISHKRVQLLASRLCYLDGGMEALRVRDGMFRFAARNRTSYRDQYDIRAIQMAAHVLSADPVIPDFSNVVETPYGRGEQLTLWGSSA